MATVEQQAAADERTALKPPADERTESSASGKEVEAKAAASPTSVAEVAAAPLAQRETAEETRRRAVERARRRLRIQLEFVENARRRVLDESHPDMSARLAKLREERERMEQRARMRSEQFEHGTAVIFAYECDEANSEFEMQCEKLRQEMLEEIHNEMEIINDQRKGGNPSERKISRNTRSTRTKNGADHSSFEFDTAEKIKKRANGYVFQPLENKLAQSEVDHDLRELTANLEATKKRRVDADAAALPLAKYYRSRLLYRDWVFQEGDEVYVMNYIASSEYVAVICGITPSEVVVLSEKGKYCRLVIMDLRQGRVVLSTLDENHGLDDDSFGSS